MTEGEVLGIEDKYMLGQVEYMDVLWKALPLPLRFSRTESEFNVPRSQNTTDVKTFCPHLVPGSYLV